MEAMSGNLPQTAEAWAFALAEACNAASRAKAVADHETFLAVVLEIQKQARTTEPVSVSLERCAIAVAPAWFEDGACGKYPEEAEQHRRKAKITAKAVLDAAGVKYVD